MGLSQTHRILKIDFSVSQLKGDQTEETDCTEIPQERASVSQEW